MVDARTALAQSDTFASSGPVAGGGRDLGAQSAARAAYGEARRVYALGTGC